MGSSGEERELARGFILDHLFNHGKEIEERGERREEGGERREGREEEE